MLTIYDGLNHAEAAQVLGCSETTVSWRVTNATHARGGFLSALHGWHEALDAKAFQQEETATHALTSGLVILNGVVVGLIAIGMFGMLVMILKHTLVNT